MLLPLYVDGLIRTRVYKKTTWPQTAHQLPNQLYADSSIENKPLWTEPDTEGYFVNSLNSTHGVSRVKWQKFWMNETEAWKAQELPKRAFPKYWRLTMELGKQARLSRF